MTFAAPQIIFLALISMEFGYAIAKHGQLKDTRHNARTTAIAMAILTAIVRWGGFFG